MGLVKKIVILGADDQEDRLDYDYYNPKVIKWVKYAHQHKSLNWTVLSTMLSSSTVGFVGKTSDKYVDDGIDFITNRNVRPFLFDVNGIQFVSESFSLEISHTRLVGNEVLVCRSGVGVGASCVYPSERNNAVAGDILILRCSGEVSPGYLMLYINSELGKALLSRECSGSGVEHLNLTAIRNAKIPKIGENDQSLIVDRFAEIYLSYRQLSERLESDKGLDFNKLSVKVDKVFAHEINVPNFVEIKRNKYFLRNHNLCERLDIPANHPDYTKLVKQIRQRPESGSLSELVEVCEERFNPDDHIGEEVSYLAIGDIDGISGKIIEPQKGLAQDIPSQMRLSAKENDLVIAVTGASTGTENMVVYRVRKEDEEFVFSADMKVLRPKDPKSAEYLQYLLKAPFVLRQITHLMYGAAMKRISISSLLDLAIPVTNSDAREITLSEIKHILSEGSTVAQQLEKISSQIQQLLSEAKLNIFDLLDDDKFSAMSAKAKEIETTMTKIEEALQ